MSVQSTMKLLSILLIGIQYVYSKHLIVVGNQGWKTHSSGDKQEECAADEATNGQAKNSYGDKIGVTCCTANGATGSRPGCASGKTYAEAEAICGAKSLRLCTADEIEGGAGQGSGCNFDAYHVWTSTDCGDHLIVVGNQGWTTHSSGDKQEECAADEATKGKAKNSYGDAIGVTCCTADGSKGSRPDCKSGKTYDEAKAHCDAKSLRLCTADEIRNGAGQGSGCNFDAYHVWTSDSCKACDTVQCAAGDFCVDGNCLRDCSAIAIDDFLVGCSSEFADQNDAISALDTRLTADVAAVKKNCEDEVSDQNDDISALDARLTADVAAVKTALDDFKASIKEREAAAKAMSMFDPLDAHVDKPSENTYVWDIGSSSRIEILMAIIGVLLFCNVIFMAYVNCWSKTGGKSKARYTKVRYMDSEDIDSEANLK